MARQAKWGGWAVLCVAAALVAFWGGNAAGGKLASPEVEPEVAAHVEAPAPKAAREVPSAQPVAAARQEAPSTPGRGELPPPSYRTRPEGEWQGMRVDESLQAICGDEGVCGQAMACMNGRCGACQSDGDCEGGEACVLDHCVKSERVACRGRSDCGEPDTLCILTGLSAGVRGNESMSAVCSKSEGGTSETPDTALAVAPAPAEKESPPVPLNRLLERARGQ